MSTAVATAPRLAIDRWTLPNGAVVLVHENPTHPTVSLRCLVHAGAAEDTTEQAGLASFTATCLLRGTAQHTFEQINDLVDRSGMSLHTGAGRHLASISTRCLAEDLPLALDLMTEVLREPTFPADELEQVRGQVLTSLRQERHNTRRVAERLFREAAYPAAHPYRLALNGEEETVRAVTRDDLVACHAARYGPARTFIVVSGAVRSAEVRDLLADRLHAWRPTVAPAPAVDDAPSPAAVTVEREVPGKTQSDLVFGTLALRRTNPDWEALRLASLIFGRLGLYGRLGASVRDAQGLAYYVYSDLEGTPARGQWAVRAGVNPANVDRALASIRAELATLQAGGVTPDELEGAQRYITGVMALQLETNGSIASLLQEIELFGLGLDYVERFPSLVHVVTRDAILAAIHRYLPTDDAVLAIAGPPR